ncbi:MAG: tRNA (N6-isopentenyl adenosine(37)-C2)-methylthiotransferase MiaB [Alphaproteobacteria bacterium]|nr:tRNA (N6-isopentenyl adenosine(37)-C2)-methylthiotransferase MiaB [Alphaproteobacteria bacterium]
MNKKLYIKTYGCQMNAYDSVRMKDVMAPLGYNETESPDDADLVILNTCHIREKAEEKVYSDLGRVRAEKEKRKASGDPVLIAVGGCVGQAEGEEIIRRAPFVDMVFGPQNYHQLPELVTKALRGKGAVVALDFEEEDKFDRLPESTSPQGVSAFLAVQEGCDKFCTFCVVPYTRGAEYSRRVSAIVDEAKKMVDSGVLEITLLGQNVNAYHGADEHGATASLADLISRLAQIGGLERIRYTTSHPRDMSEDLIALHGSEPKLMPYLHLPIQSGSDEVLKRMNRKHTAAFYIDIIERLRRQRPDIALSSDFIVGFPGESDKHFEETMALVRHVHYAQAYSFKYSPRPGTPAATDDRQLPESVKDERLQALQALLRQQQQQFNEASVGKTLPVLFTKDGKHDGQLLGKSPYLQSVYVQGTSGIMNRIVGVRITGGYLNSLAGEIARETPIMAA